MDRRVPKLLTLKRMHHPKGNVNRMYFQRRERGREKRNLEMCLKITTIGLNSFLESSDDWMLLKSAKEFKQKEKKLVRKI